MTEISQDAWDHAVRCVENFVAVHGGAEAGIAQAASRVLREGLGLGDERVGWLVQRLVGDGFFAHVAAQNLIMGAVVGLLAADYDRPLSEAFDPSDLLGPA